MIAGGAEQEVSFMDRHQSCPANFIRALEWMPAWAVILFALIEVGPIT